MYKLKVVMYVVDDHTEVEVLTKITDLGVSSSPIENIAEEMRLNISDAIDRGMDDDRVLSLSEQLLDEEPVPTKVWINPTMEFKPFYW